MSAIARATKKPAKAGSFENVDDEQSSQGLDLGAQAALVARGLVLVDQAVMGVAVHHRLGGLVGGLRRGLVLGFDRLQHLADRGAQHRALAGVAHAAHFGLPGALLGGLDVGHGLKLRKRFEKRLASMREQARTVNPSVPREQGAGIRAKARCAPAIALSLLPSSCSLPS